MALDVVDQLVRSSAVDVVVIDSVAGKQALELLTLDIVLYENWAIRDDKFWTEIIFFVSVYFLLFFYFFCFFLH